MIRTILTTRLACLPIMAIALSSAACGSDATTPTPVIEQLIEIDTGPIQPGDQRISLFALSQTATVQVMVAGVVLDNPVRSISPNLLLRLSRLDGTDCKPMLELPVQPRLTAALHQFLEPGSYCVTVIDQGSLPGPATVTVRTTSPALVSVDGTSPGTVNFSSTITPMGTAARSFQASAGGRVNVKLSSLSGEPVSMGLGIGVFDTDAAAAGCRIAQTVLVPAGPSPQLSVDVDAGYYCAMLFDVGNLIGPQSFSLSVEHP